MANHLSLPGNNKLFRWFIALIVITLVLRFILAIYIPFSGDEAYYYLWGKFPALGYYDHTPLIGWLMYVMLLFGKSQVILRLPCIILPALITIAIYLSLRRYDVQKALLLSILFLITPINLYLVLISTDVPLIFFNFLSGLFLFLAIRERDNIGYYLLSGLCLGLAFLAKYFAVLLALAYILYFFGAEKNRKRTLGFLLLFLCVLPFGLFNLYWNYTHAWANILFNVFNRNHDAAFHWSNIFVYLLFLFYLVTPAVFYYLLKNYRSIFKGTDNKEFNLVPFLFLVPFGFYFLLSFIKSVGFHWLFSFIPFIYLGLISYASTTEIKRALKFTGWYSGIHLLIVAGLLMMPLSYWQHWTFNNDNYADVVYFFKHKEVRAALNQYNNDFIFTSHSYADADIMTYDSGQYSPTFGIGSYHGREGDFVTDFRTMAHKNFLILDTSPLDLKLISPYFTHWQQKSFVIDGATFYYVLAYDFNYPRYRNIVLRFINNTYWQVPYYLPHTPSFYCQRYFADEGCSANKL